MWIRRKEVKKLTEEVKALIQGEDIDIRQNKEGVMRILRNDIHTLATMKKEQLAITLQERDVLKNTIADISHQLKTPLTSMMIMADLLEDAPPETQLDFISNIKTTLERTEWLVSSLLKMAKLEAKTIEFKRETVSFKTLVEEAMDGLNIQFELKNQQLRLIGDGVFTCDKRWTVEALTNLLKNASEHSPKNATITVESGANPLSRWINIIDEGPGIKREDVGKLFKRFEISTTPSGFGIGIPLALSIMKSQFGDIGVDIGGKGRGATFTMKFYK